MISATRKSQIHQWSLEIKIKHALFIETLFRINLCSREKLIQTANIWLPGTKYVVSAVLLWYIS